MSYSLTLLFSCALAVTGDGICGTPPQVTFPDRYPTLISCMRAGDQWTKPAANPTKTVRLYRCNTVSN